MQFFLLLAVMLLLGLAGCGKKQSAASSVPPIIAVETNATSVSATSVEGQVDPFLTQQLHVFMQRKGRFPTDFAELVRTCLDSRPRTPQGMKWVIDTTSQEVKLVKQ
jgi:hypothetical protein